jgi:hypothetical protein
MEKINKKIEFDTSPRAKRDRFLRLATSRTQAVIDRLRILSHCANRSAYDYDDKDIEKIFNTIKEEAEAARLRFIKKEKRQFNL